LGSWGSPENKTAAEPSRAETAKEALQERALGDRGIECKGEKAD